MIVQLTHDHARQVTQALREADQAEVYATRWNDDPADLADECMEYPGPKFAALADDGTPIAIGGVALWRSTLGQAWLMGTDRIAEKRFEIMSASKKVCKSLLTDAGFLRIQVHTASFRTDIHRWLDRLGLRRDGELPKYGKDGSTFYIYSMVED